jgi:hypothetical protein
MDENFLRVIIPSRCLSMLKGSNIVPPGFASALNPSAMHRAPISAEKQDPEKYID